MPSVYMTTDELDLVENLVREGIWQLDHEKNQELQVALKLPPGGLERTLAVDKLDRISAKINAARYQSTFTVRG